MDIDADTNDAHTKPKLNWRYKLRYTHIDSLRKDLTIPIIDAWSIQVVRTEELAASGQDNQ
jgi:hypothetical protein